MQSKEDIFYSFTTGLGNYFRPRVKLRLYKSPLSNSGQTSQFKANKLALRGPYFPLIWFISHLQIKNYSSTGSTIKWKLRNMMSFFISCRLSVGVPTSNGLDRPPATYYAQSALAHHHHHHQHPNVNGNCQISELHSPTINITTIPVTHGNSPK